VSSRYVSINKTRENKGSYNKQTIASNTQTALTVLQQQENVIGVQINPHVCS